MKTVESLVAEGARHLDSLDPKWADKVTKTIDITDPYLCAAGQSVGYPRVRSIGRKMGFSTDYALGRNADFNAAWETEVAKRKNTPSLKKVNGDLYTDGKNYYTVVEKTLVGQRVLKGGHRGYIKSISVTGQLEIEWDPNITWEDVKDVII